MNEHQPFKFSSAMRPTKVVVVVLPAEPVIPITLHGADSRNICELFESGIPRFWASAIKGMVNGTPPEGQTRSVSIQQREWMLRPAPIRWANLTSWSEHPEADLRNADH